MDSISYSKSYAWEIVELLLDATVFVHLYVTNEAVYIAEIFLSTHRSQVDQFGQVLHFSFVLHSQAAWMEQTLVRRSNTSVYHNPRGPLRPQSCLMICWRNGQDMCVVTNIHTISYNKRIHNRLSSSNRL